MTTKVSIVTEAGQGIGKALAGVLLEEGYKVNDFYRPHPKDEGSNSFSLCVSSHLDGGGGVPIFPGPDGGGVPTLDGGGGTYLGLGGGDTYLGWGRGGYLPWMGEAVPTLDMGEGYLPWMGEGVPTLDGEGVPTLDGGWGTYRGWGRGYLPMMQGTYLGWGRGYLPWMGEGVPTLDW